jgi:predicted NUDIX family phosphoesterase
MGIFLTSAYKVLKAEGSPLSAKELTSKALEQGLLETSGLTPHQTMKSKISTDILKNKEKSVFKRTSTGQFALKEWSSLGEYSAPRHQKAVFDEDILVFERKHLYSLIVQEGFTDDKSDLSNLIRKLNGIIFSTRRKDAESNNDLIQLISVFVVRYKDLILTHKRTKRLPESRLHDFYSIIFGGHLTKDDFMPLLGHIDFKREFSEELRIKETPTLQYRGLIYDTSREVSKIHLGLVFDVFLVNEQYEIGERGYLMDSKFESIQDIAGRIQDFENWSQILLRQQI